VKVLGRVITVLILIALIGIGALIYQTCAGTQLIQRIDKTLPDSAAAPFEITTMTRIYMARVATKNEDGSVRLTGWYVKDGKKWIYHEETITLPPLLHPVISKR